VPVKQPQLGLLATCMPFIKRLAALGCSSCLSTIETLKLSAGLLHGCVRSLHTG
jgi:hypothetical protein